MPQIETITTNLGRGGANFVGEVDDYPETNHFTDEEQNMREIERIMTEQKTTAVVWNPFRGQNNLCSGGTYGDSGFGTLEQFVPYILFRRNVPRITPKKADEQSILIGETVVGSDVAQVGRSAVETAATLIKIHGAVGASKIESLAVSDFRQVGSKLLIYEIVMQGWNAQGLLEDLPEYFGVRSSFLPEKYDAVAGSGRDNSFTMTAEEILEKAGKDGVLLTRIYSDLLKFEPQAAKYKKQPCLLGKKEIALGKQLISELRNASLKMHEYAVGAEGVLPKSKEHLETVKRGPTFGKQKLDELDRYLMLHFPSFPMDTEIEKSERNQRRGMEAIIRNMPNTANVQPDNSKEFDLLEKRNALLEKQNELMIKRLEALEKTQKK